MKHLQNNLLTSKQRWLVDCFRFFLHRHTKRN